MLQKPVVLYVENDALSREIMQVLLQDMLGLAHLTIFEDSTNFLERVAKLQPKPDIVLLDIHVEPYDGFTMLQMLRRQADYQSIPIAALTASVMNEEIQQLRDVGFNGVIAKPINMEDFPTMLNRLLDGEEIWTVLS